MGRRRYDRPVRLRRMGRRVMGGRGRQLVFLDELSGQLVQFGPCGQDLAQRRVLAPEIALRELHGGSDLVARCRWGLWAS